MRKREWGVGEAVGKGLGKIDMEKKLRKQ